MRLAGGRFALPYDPVWSNRLGDRPQASRHSLADSDAAVRVTTPRLVLRRWQPGDLDSFAALNSDPEVMRHFPSTYDRSATAAMITA
ncbi:MAG TPA: GNAT family N-acetyltransferase, partial [Propionibacteriaceae bacterium]